LYFSEIKWFQEHIDATTYFCYRGTTIPK
jgi:hypothetical protein